MKKFIIALATALTASTAAYGEEINHTWEDGSSYVGTYFNDAFNGRGIYTEAGGAYVASGIWKDGVFVRGTLTVGRNKFIGDFVDWKLHGHGIYVGSDGSEYYGDFVNGVYEGVGTYNYAEGGSYTGEWAGGRENGLGKTTEEDGSYYVGNYVNGWQHGTGTLDKGYGNLVTGNFVEGVPVGDVYLTYSDGTKGIAVYENGSAISANFTYTDGTTYDGEVGNGKIHGYGKLTDSSGDVIYEGRFENGTYTIRSGGGVTIIPLGRVGRVGRLFR